MLDSVKGLLEKVRDRQMAGGKRGFSEEKIAKNIKEKSRKADGKVSLLN